MAFKADFSKAQEGGNSLKPEGDYEVLIDTAEVSRTQTGKERINIVYVVRNDVTQSCQNGLIFDSIWKKKEPNQDDQSIGGFDFGRLMAIAKAAKLPAGKDYAGLDDFLAELNGKPLRVHLYHNKSDGRVYENISKHEETALTTVKHKSKSKKPTAAPARKPAPAVPAAPAASGAPAAVSEADDDYPF